MKNRFLQYIPCEKHDFEVPDVENSNQKSMKTPRWKNGLPRCSGDAKMEGTYKDYIKSIQDSTDLTDKQKEIEIDEAKAAREKMTFSSFQNTQTIQNNAIIAKIRPQQEKVVM